MDDLYDRCYQKINNEYINIKLEDLLLDPFNQDIYFKIIKDIYFNAINIKNIVIKICLGTKRFLECKYLKALIMDLIKNNKYNFVPLYLEVYSENINKIFGDCVKLENNLYYWPKIRHIYINNNLSYIQEINIENDFIKMLTHSDKLFSSILKYEQHFIYILKNMISKYENSEYINILIDNKLFFYNNTFIFFIKKLLQYKKIQIIMNTSIKITFTTKHVTVSNKHFTSLKKIDNKRKSQHKRKIYNY